MFHNLVGGQGGELFFLNVTKRILIHFLLFFLLFCLAVLCDMWELSSLTRVRLVPPALETWSPNHWTTREVLSFSFFLFFFFFIFALLILPWIISSLSQRCIPWKITSSSLTGEQLWIVWVKAASFQFFILFATVGNSYFFFQSINVILPVSDLQKSSRVYKSQWKWR